MFKGVHFAIQRGQYIKAAMDQIASFRPDGKSPAGVQAMIDQLHAAENAYQTSSTTLSIARGELREEVDLLHTACVQIFPIMKVRYRNDPGSLAAINRLPVDDRSIAETVARADAIAALWVQLPLLLGPPPLQFKPWDTMDLTTFNGMLSAAKARHDGFPAVDQQNEIASGHLHESLAALEDFNTAALITGRAQFEEGTPEREVIDAIPTVPGQSAPGKAVITSATSPAPGTVHLVFEADGATSFDVLQKGPGDLEFFIVANDLTENTYDASALPPGVYEFKVVGKNSVGSGPESDVVSVTVT